MPGLHIQTPSHSGQGDAGFTHTQTAFHVGPGWAPVGQSWAPNGPRVGLTGAHLGMLLGYRHPLTLHRVNPGLHIQTPSHSAQGDAGFTHTDTLSQWAGLYWVSTYRHPLTVGRVMPGLHIQTPSHSGQGYTGFTHTDPLSHWAG